METNARITFIAVGLGFAWISLLMITPNVNLSSAQFAFWLFLITVSSVSLAVGLGSEKKGVA